MKPILEKALGTEFEIFDLRDGNIHATVPIIESLTALSLSDNPEDSDIPFIPNSSYHMIRKLISGNHNFWLEGPAGSGKSSNVKQAAKSLKRPFYRINMNGHSTDEALIGAARIKGDESTGQPTMYWLKGMLEKAMLEGLDDDGKVVGPAAVFLIDEFEAAPPETAFVLQRVLEPEKVLIIDNDGGRMIKAHPEFVICAAGNTKGTGDIRGGYAGVNQVNFATRDRFAFMLTMDYDYPLEKRILTSVMNEKYHDKVDKMLALAKAIRKANIDGAISFPMSIRRLVAWARGFEIFNSVGKSFLYAIGGFLEDDQLNTVSELFQRTFGVRPDSDHDLLS
ncbi:AAA family ATPase [Acinetobacter sp.]|uniref:AAA family ATPase n=1 Tax=Acinetobacter sp. TaxID=472 RepID=UPI003D05CE86